MRSTFGFEDQMTLREARGKLRELLKRGHRCPCCTQYAKVYRRKLYATPTRDLIAFYRRFGRDWGSFPDLSGPKGGDFAKCRYWGLIEEQPSVSEEGGRIGVWRVTPLGEKFILGQVRVPHRALIYDGHCLGLEGEPVTVRDCLGDRFDYQELMGRLNDEGLVTNGVPAA